MSGFAWAGLGFVCGALLWDAMWRLVNRLQDQLVEEQKLLIKEQNKLIDLLRDVA